MPNSSKRTRFYPHHMCRDIPDVRHPERSANYTLRQKLQSRTKLCVPKVLGPEDFFLQDIDICFRTILSEIIS